MLGVLFAILSAVSFGFSNITARRGVVGSSASYGLYITVTIGVPLFLIAAIAFGQLLDTFDLPVDALILLSAAGILHFLVGRYCNYRCIDAIGANRSQPIQMTNTVYSVIVAVWLLGETLNWLMGVGIALIMVGPLLMVDRRRQPAPAAPVAQGGGATSAAAVAAAKPNAATSPRYAEGYTFGLLSATAYGTSPIMIRYALQDTDLAIAGGLVAYTAATAVLLGSLVIPGRLRDLRGFDVRVVPLFLASAFAVFLAQLFRFLALAIAPVTVVTPLTRLSIVVTPTLSFIFNRHLESFSPRVLSGIALSVAGVVLLAVGIA